ncbi:MAG: TetR family transcriptional regulator [Myxococcales bacterium]|nr:TetR family transcriptional regulator [Myxococcales bacterium]
MANEIEDKHRGRPPTLSRDTILAIAAKIPVEGFSLRVVADRLGVSPQSIYYYFNSKNALLGVLAEQSVAQFPPIEASDWQSYYRNSMLGYRRRLLASDSPALAPEITSTWARFNDQPSEAILLRMEAFVDFFVRAGFTAHQAIEVWNLGVTLVARSVITRLSDGEIEQHWQGMRADIESLGVERFPRLSAALAEQGPQMEEMFERMVEIAIEGVAAFYGVE